MNKNLKDHVQEKETLKYIQSILNNELVTKGLSKKLNKIIDFYSEIELDLEMGGESILELDKPRLEAIEERDKFLVFLKTNDDI